MLNTAPGTGGKKGQEPRLFPGGKIPEQQQAGGPGRGPRSHAPRQSSAPHPRGPRPAPTLRYCSILSAAVKYASVSELMRVVAWKLAASWKQEWGLLGCARAHHAPAPQTKAMLPTSIGPRPTVPHSPFLSSVATEVDSCGGECTPQTLSHPEHPPLPSWFLLRMLWATAPGAH